MDCIGTERADLYRCMPPEGLWVPFLVTPVAVEYKILGEKGVVQAVQGLKMGRAGGP